jgi:hypothetical protein
VDDITLLAVGREHLRVITVMERLFRENAEMKKHIEELEGKQRAEG